MTKSELRELIGRVRSNKYLMRSETDYITEALKEVEQYRAIGTPEECSAAEKKQTAKKPDYEGDGYADGQLVYDTWICPCCNTRYEVDYDVYNFCPNCGQRLDWAWD